MEQSQQMLAAEDTPRYPVDADDNGTAEMDSDEDGSDSNEDGSDSDSSEDDDDGTTTSRRWRSTRSSRCSGASRPRTRRTSISRRGA